MFVSKKRTFLLLSLVSLASLWVIFQNVTLNKSLFQWSDRRRHLIQMSRVQPLRQKKNLPISAHAVGFAFQPPPALENEERSEGYNAEDMYFRRWQVAHNVEPVRPKRGQPGGDKRMRGWSQRYNGAREDEIYEALKRRQEERRRQVEEMQREQYEQRMNETMNETEEESEGDDDHVAANDMSSSYVIQNEWLKSRLEDFCNERGVMEGDEGKVPEGHELQSVHVLTRHGDRTPQENAKTGQLAPFKWECSLVVANQKVRSIQLEKFLRVIRAGMKDASVLEGRKKVVVLSIPLKESSIHCYAAQLTPQGWVQHMRLGDFMKKRYWHQLGLNSGSSKRGISVKSTSSPRTIHSAIAFIFGFLPNFTLRDVELIRQSQSATFCTDEHCACGAVEQLRDNVEKRYHARHKQANVTALGKQASRLMYIKEPLYSIPNPSRLVELLTARSCHKSNLPCTDNGCVDEAMFEKVFQTTDTVMADLRREENNSAEMYGRLAMHPLLKSISTTMQYLERDHPSLPRFYLYSGHDMTLTPMLDALGLRYPWPGYASRLVFEHWYNTALNKSALRILYNGEDVTRQVRFCRSKLMRNGLCSFSAFYRFLDRENLRVFNAETYEEACSWGIGE